MIEIDDLTKSFKKNRVIDALSASFSSTGVSVIVGTNGSGKTTLLNMLTNLLEADGGGIRIDGIPPGSQAYKSKFFYLPSDFYLPGYMTGKEYVQFVLSRYETSEEGKAPLLMDLLDLADGQNKTIESYSFGMKKKIQIVAAIAANTDYIIADEIFGGLDFDTSLLVQELFAAVSTTKKVIIVSHERNTIDRFPEDIRLMRQGSLVNFEGTPEELTDVIKQEEVLREKLNIVSKHFMSTEILL